MLKLKYGVLSFLVLGLLIFTACSEEVADLPIEDGLDYFPIEQGYWAVYQIDSTIYSDFVEGGIETISMQLREEYVEAFIDNAGRTGVVINRFRRYNDSQPWEQIVPQVWYQAVSDAGAERIEGEKRFLNLVFPMLEGRTWEGNAYLNTEDVGSGWTDRYELGVYDGWEYEYGPIGVAAQFGDLSFNETVTVTQHDYEDLVDKVFSTETYAKNVGLVYKEQWILNLGGNDITISDGWPERAERGHVMTKRLIDHMQ